MNIAIVRGPFLNKWEMQNYESLSDRHRVTAFTTTSHIFPLEEIDLPVKELSSPDALLYRVSGKLAGLFNRTCNKFFGWNYYMYGLENELKDVDIVNTVELHHTFTNQVIEAKKKYKFKVAVTVWENIPFAWDKHPVRRKIKYNVIKNADLFIAVTGKIRETLLLEGIDTKKIAVIPPGIDLNKFKPGEKNAGLLMKLGIKMDDFVVLFIGRFTREKGVYDLIHAAKKILSDGTIRTPVKFLLVGEGTEKKGMEKLINRLEIPGSVILAQNLPYRDLPGIHNLADIFVLPSIPTKSWQEQFGYVLVESMACAKPVISTSSGSIPEVIGNSGILIPPNDYLSLYERLKGLIQDKQLRNELGKKACENVKIIYDIKKVSDKLDSVFCSLLK